MGTWLQTPSGLADTSAGAAFVLSDVTLINMRLQRLCRGCARRRACVAGSGLSCVLQQAVARNGGGFLAVTDWLIFAGLGFG